MARKREDNAVVAPLIGSGILGGGAYGSHRLNRFMEDLGISSKFELNPEALKAIDDYTNLVPDPKNPSSFAYQYAQAANRAGGVQLFLGDPKKRKAWEWDINNPALRRGIKDKFPDIERAISNIEKTLNNENLSFLKHIPGHKTLLDRLAILRTGVTDAKNNFLPLKEFAAHVAALKESEQRAWAKANGKITPEDIADAMKKAKKSLTPEEAFEAAFQAKKRSLGVPTEADIAVQLAHVPEMARSPVESYVRLLNEVAPDVNTNKLADNTVEALLNYRKPTYKDHLGKVFESPSEYLNEMWTPKGHKKYKGVFDDYINSVRNLEAGSTRNFFASATPSEDVINAFRHDIALHLSPTTSRPIRDKVTGAIREHLIPKKLTPELANSVGRRADWGLDIVGKGKNEFARGIKVTKPGTLAKGIRSVQDIWDLSHNHLGLKALNAITTARYTEAAKPYKLMSDIVRRAQVLRNGKLRAGLALGSLALGGMGAANIYRNHSAKKENRRLINRIRNWIGDQVDKI